MDKSQNGSSSEGTKADKMVNKIKYSSKKEIVNMVKSTQNMLLDKFNKGEICFAFLEATLSELNKLSNIINNYFYKKESINRKEKE